MIKKVNTDCGVLTYNLEIKKVKNINVRIKKDLTVNVSANKYTPQREIDGFLKSKAAYIMSALDKYKSRIENKEPECTYRSGDIIRMLGFDLQLSVKESDEASVKLDDGILTVTVRDMNDTERIKKVIDDLETDVLKIYIERYSRKACEDFGEYNIEYPEIKYRKMKSRYGSCCPSKKTVVFNKALIKAPAECIEMVVYHEFTHFVHLNHSPAFYAELQKHIPNHRQLKKKLEDCSIL